MCKIGKDVGDVIMCEGFKKEVPGDFNGYKEDKPSMPEHIPLLFRVSRDGCLAGIFTSHALKKDKSVGGGGVIKNDGGSWEGTEELIGYVS